MCGSSAWEKGDHKDDNADEGNANQSGINNTDQYINGKLTDEISQMIFNDLVSSEIDKGSNGNNRTSILNTNSFKNICFVSVGLNHMC